MWDQFLILHKLSPLVIIRNHEFLTPSDILLWYSRVYGYDLKDLSWMTVRRVDAPSPVEMGRYMASL